MSARLGRPHGAEESQPRYARPVSTPPEYLALRAKLDSFAASVSVRRADGMRCGPGCDACCRVQLSLCDLEADVLREGLKQLEPEVKLQLAAEPEDPARCALLDPGGRCRAYDARPLVCRSQGLPLRYPPDVVPASAVRARAEGGEITWCPLNFEADPPEPDDVLDAERVDLILAMLNRREAAEPLRRTPIQTLIRELAPDRR